MFIRLHMMLCSHDDSTDQAVIEATFKEHGWAECLINTNEIQRIHTDLEGFNWIRLKDESYIKIKESLTEVHEKINRSHNLPLLQ